MASKNELIKSKVQGIFYREHPNRKHGVTKDRQWIIVQKIAGTRRVSTIGWGSAGCTFGDVVNKAAEYKANYKWNENNPDHPPKPICKQDEDNAAKLLKEQIERDTKIEQLRNITILQLWNDVYYPLAEQNKKSATVVTERTLFDKWLRKDYGGKKLIDLTNLDFARISKKIIKAGRSPRTVHYVVSILLQIWSTAFDNKLVDVQPPRRKTLNLPDIDNERTRAFTVPEAKQFLAELHKRSQQWHNICLLSLLTGLRASEVFKLQRSDIDLDRGLIFLRTPKKAKSQHLQISSAASKHLVDMIEQASPNNALLVCTTNTQQIKWVSNTVQRTIDDLGLNDGMEKKDRLTFHSLRHTAATWALEQGEDIYHVSKMLRHTTVRMTEQRYSHLSNDTIRRTADSIGGLLDEQPDKVVKITNNSKS